MGDWTPPHRRFSELPLRLASALILIPLALAAVWIGGVWLAAACSVFALVMMHEWGVISGMAHARLVSVLAAVSCFSLAAGNPALVTLMAVAVALLAFVLGGSGLKARFTATFGVAYVLAMVGGLFFLREGPWDGQAGALYFMSFVWASDAAAYFFGRLLSGPRLMPRESPNKTWSGAISAVVACAVCGFAAAAIEGVSPGPWIAMGIAISIVAQAGDLFESGLKRRFGVKDSGRILPGHGGLLDRVDGLGAVSIAGCLGLYAVPGLDLSLGL